MPVSRIMPYSGVTANSKTKTNATTNVAFQARKIPPAPHLSIDFIHDANSLARQCREASGNVSKARTLNQNQDISSSQRALADRTINRGHKIISQGKDRFEAQIDGSHLRIDAFEDGVLTRYLIGLNEGGRVTTSSAIQVQSPGEGNRFSTFNIPLADKIERLEPLLKAILAR